MVSHQLPFLISMCFSAKSPLAEDDWHRDAKRPYQLVLMPGYKPPPLSEIHPGDHEFTWYDRPVRKPTIVWDSYMVEPLLEAVYVNFRKDLVGDYIRVRHADSGSWVSDLRSEALLATRPVPDYSWFETRDSHAFFIERRANYAARSSWTYDCMVKCSLARRQAEEKGRRHVVRAKDEEACAWSSIVHCHQAAMKDDTAASYARRQSEAEKRVNETRGQFNFRPQTNYRSPLRFRFLELQNLPKYVPPMPGNMTVLPPEPGSRPTVARTSSKVSEAPTTAASRSLFDRIFGRKG